MKVHIYSSVLEFWNLRLIEGVLYKVQNTGIAVVMALICNAVDDIFFQQKT